jgi:hypothetical protein
MSTKFKVGDRVRRLESETWRGNWNRFEHIVTKVSGDRIEVTNDPDPQYSNTRIAAYFELVSPAKSELEELVEKANQGYAARDVLREKYSDQVRAYYTGNSLNEGALLKDIHTTNWCKGYKIVPKKKVFQSYTMPEKHFVCLHANENNLHVGCQVFSIQDLTNALRALCRDSSAVYFKEFSASRSGVRYGANTISWASADDLLSRLEAYLNQEGA